jgi:hypothetical protein
MVCIAVALARVLPVVGTVGQLTEYGPANGETVNRHKHLRFRAVHPGTRAGALAGHYRGRNGGWPGAAAGDW